MGIDYHAFFFFFLPLLYPLGAYASVQSDIHEKFILQIASALGFQYIAAEPAGFTNALTFSVGEDHVLLDILSGTYRSFPIRIYTHSYRSSTGRNGNRAEETVCDVLLNGVLPHILINFKYPSDDVEPVTLEGTFNEDFSVYVERGRQIEIRQLLEPDVMETLMQHFKNLQIEIMPEPGGSRMYIIRPWLMDNRAEFLSLMEIVDNFIDMLLPGAGAVSRDIVTTPDEVASTKTPN
jgi:hypothetical protein